MTSSIVVASKKLDSDEEQTLTYLLTIWRLAFLHRRSPHRQASVTSSLSAWVSPSKRRPTDVVFGEEKKRISWLCLAKAIRAGRLRTKADRWKDWTKTWRKPRTPIRLLRNGYDSDHDVTCIRAITRCWGLPRLCRSTAVDVTLNSTRAPPELCAVLGPQHAHQWHCVLKSKVARKYKYFSRKCGDFFCSNHHLPYADNGQSKIMWGIWMKYCTRVGSKMGTQTKK